MNHIYKSIFNKALGVFTAVPEFASAHGKVPKELLSVVLRKAPPALLPVRLPSPLGWR